MVNYLHEDVHQNEKWWNLKQGYKDIWKLGRVCRSYRTKVQIEIDPKEKKKGLLRFPWLTGYCTRNKDGFAGLSVFTCLIGLNLEDS